MRAFIYTLTVGLIGAGVAGAGAAPPVKQAAPPPKPAVRAAQAIPERLEVSPAEVRLESRRAYRQLVVTGYFGGDARDVTGSAAYRVTGPGVVGLKSGRVSALADGKSAVIVSLGGRSVRVPVTVTNAAKADPVRFKFETLPVLTKQGCASGSCHGSPHGKGGFSLSLFGYDPRIDRVSLTRDGFNRRIDALEPEESLILKKPLLEVSHVGGKRLRKTDAAYHVLRDWVFQGADVELPAVECRKIVVTPGTGRVLKAPHLEQQISVLASYSDGTARDVSAIATYESSHPAVATVDADGRITGHARGQAAISVRYLHHLEAVNVTVIEDVPGFRWSPPVENNVIDREVNAKLRQLQYLPSTTCTDSVFIRRLYLDLTGMLPAPEKTRAFLSDTAPDKRARLVDELLNTEEYARFWALKKADLMRVSPRRLKDGRAELFAAWIVEAIRKNMPYDEFAREILTAEGDTQEVPAANYFLAIPTMEERTEMTAEIFMGSRLECAKCHNHPFENWTMGDYYSLGAVFVRTQADNGTIVLANSGETVHPASKETLKPWGMSDAQMQSGLDRRAAYAEWLTKPGNPFFARVEVNRIWADLLGRGIVNPVDDFRSSNPAVNGPLLDALAREFEKSGFDRKHVIRLICNSRTYQRSTETNRFNETDDVLFSHARPRLLTAEQLKDAVALATRSLPTADEAGRRAAELEKQVEARAGELDRQYPLWLRESAAKVAALPYWLGAWYTCGPLKAADAGGAAGREAAHVDVAAPFVGAQPWKLQPTFRDGAANALPDGSGTVSYVYRRIYAAESRKLPVDVQSASPLELWLNGKPLVAAPGPRGVRRFSLDLQPGENQVLLKVTRARVPSTLRMRVVSSASSPVKTLELAPHAVEFLAAALARRTDEQKRLLRAEYVETDAQVHGLRAQIARLRGRMEYATQRPYPEPSSFTAAFGQPQRETACTCERQTAPTLLQALELLNGGMAYQSASGGAAKYAALEPGKLLDELYLSALCRLPTERERATAGKYLAGAAERNTAVADLVWTVVNTQEFLFQH